MFRLTNSLKMLSDISPNGSGKPSMGKGPVVIWNLTKKCNLECLHCYGSYGFSGNRDQTDELSTEDALKVLDDFKKADCFSVILSGGEPLYRKDIFQIAEKAKRLGFFLSLSTNGTTITDHDAKKMAKAGFDYIGISLDGIGALHDKFRGVKGSFDRAVTGINRCKKFGLRVGIRFTLTRINIADLPEIFKFVEDNEITKLYLSHLVYSGRGGDNQLEDLTPKETREAMEFILKKAKEYVDTNRQIDIVTGNNEADAPFLLLKLMEEDKDKARKLYPVLKRWGGNSAGRGIVNVDTKGDTHPDPLLSGIVLGNVLEKEFSKIWNDKSNETLRRLREKPRNLQGRCGTCGWLEVCNGANRVRAYTKTGSLWESDPACYLTDDEINNRTVNEIYNLDSKPHILTGK